MVDTWPRDEPHKQLQYEAWLNQVEDPETGQYYHKRDKDGSIVKGSCPEHLISQIVRIRTNDGKQNLYSNRYLLGNNVGGDPVREVCSNPETWRHTEFAYKKEYDPIPELLAQHRAS